MQSDHRVRDHTNKALIKKSQHYTQFTLWSAVWSSRSWSRVVSSLVSCQAYAWCKVFVSVHMVCVGLVLDDKLSQFILCFFSNVRGLIVSCQAYTLCEGSWLSFAIDMGLFCHRRWAAHCFSSIACSSTHVLQTHTYAHASKTCLASISRPGPSLKLSLTPC